MTVALLKRLKMSHLRFKAARAGLTAQENTEIIYKEEYRPKGKYPK
jgi:hypothetical protein